MKYFLLISFFYLNHLFVFSNPFIDSVSINVENQVSQRMSTSGNKGFMENKGQMKDNNGNPLPFVLFCTEAPGLNLWITETGMVIQTSQLTKKSIDEKDLTVLEKAEQKATNKKKTHKILNWERIDIEFKGASIQRGNILKEGTNGTGFNYFYGHCPDGIYGVKEYDKITITDVYPGIDWVIYRKTNGEIKYDFVVHPGANYKDIKLLYRSKTPIDINKQGQLEFFTAYGDLNEESPVSFYQDKIIETQFQIETQKSTTIHGDSGYETTVAFQLSIPNNTSFSADLIIDPQLVWSTFYGGNGLDGPMATDTDDAGNIFITGYTSSTSFPVQNPASGAYFQGTFAAVGDLFILKFNNAGVQQWATFYGGNNNDRGWSIDVDIHGNVFVTGDTQSTDFPILNSGSGAYFQGNLAGQLNVFILKLNNSGVLLWATYFGGNALDFGYNITTDSGGNVYLTGATNSATFPTLALGGGSYFQGSGGGFKAFIIKLNNSGVLLWSTYFGGTSYETGFAVHTDIYDNLYVTGYTESANFPVVNPGSGAYFQGTLMGPQDAFLSKFSPTGTLLWSTYYGGTNYERGLSIASDPTGSVFVSGHTYSNDFPIFDPGAGAFFQGTFGGVQDVFILKFNNLGARLWATYYGGTFDDAQDTYDNLAIDACGNLYVCLKTGSTALPLQQSCENGYFDNSHGGSADIVVALFSNEGVHKWSSFIGGNGLDIRGALALDTENNLFITGEWCGNSVNNASYPLVDYGGYYDPTFNGGGDDGFIVKFSPSPIVADITTTQPNCTNVCGGSATVNTTETCPLSYLWSNGQTTQTATGLCEGIYTVTVSRGLCGGGDTLLTVEIISDETILVPAFSSISPICSGETLAPLPTTSTNGVSGTWSPALSNTTTQTYTFTPSNVQCASTTTLTITVNAAVEPAFTSVSAICAGETLTPLPTTSNNGISGSWSPALTNTATQTYTFTPETGQCATTTMLTIIVNPSPTVLTSSNAPVCEGDILHLSTSSVVGGVYTWSGPNGFSSTDQNPVIQSVTTANGGTYTATVTVNGCSSAPSPTQVDIHPGVTVSVIPVDPTITTGQTIGLTASGATSYTWFPATGLSCSNCPNPIASPTSTITYSVVGTNASGCTDTATVTVFNQVICAAIFVPTIFSPNDDGLNDFECVLGDCISSLTFTIYNRWGEVVFESDSIDQCWDGTFKGEKVNSDVFVYKLYATLNTGVVVQKSGNISVLR